MISCYMLSYDSVQIFSPATGPKMGVFVKHYKLQALLHTAHRKKKSCTNICHEGEIECILCQLCLNFTLLFTEAWYDLLLFCFLH